MIVGLGHDVVDLALFAPLVEERLAPWPEGGARSAPAASAFVEATFTAEEVRYATKDGRGSAVEHLAVRFAAKEATLKALDAAAALWELAPAPVPLRDVEVVRDARGRPTLRLRGAAERLFGALELTRALVSLSHDGRVASAVVVVER